MIISELHRPINFAQSPYITIIYIFCFFVMGINFVVSNQSFFDLFTNFFNIKIRDFKDSSPINKITNSFVGFVGLILYALLITDTIQSDIWIKDYAIDYKSLLINSSMIFIALLLYLGYNLLMTKILQYIFNVNRYNIENYIDIFVGSFIGLGVMLFFVSFINTYFLLPQHYVLYALGGCLLIFYIVKVNVSLFQFFSFEAHTLYQFFLYLCIFEILPILVLIKYFSAIIV